MRMTLSAAALFVAAALPGLAADVSEDEAAKVLAALAEIQCEMDPGNIEKNADGYELDDVFCADGQFDMKMDFGFKVTDKAAD